ncbi:putative WRKY transcription factor 19 [Phytophthora citrophthora]|uniref:WRKY transcription factor 19 n=1 Tax=Phytophthora citrophthora TaxID=4793 RepID=A0AAD9GR08_9STRA|nr:putative WRKY transcription factor 19 [Phytophthora citrophthora]
MHCKTDITFLLNPSGPVKPETPCFSRSPSMSLFRSLSPVVSSPEPPFTYRQTLAAPFIMPRDKRYTNLRCYGSDKSRLPMISMAALCVVGDLSSNSSVDGDDSPTDSKPKVRKTNAPPCQIEDCKNLAVSRGLCVRHGGGSKCTFQGCIKRAKLNQRCFQHGGFKMCTKPGCTKKAKRYGHCWSHGGGHICDAPECTKVSTQGGFCWAHGGGNRCKHEGCNRRSFQRYDYYCQRHANAKLVASTKPVMTR